MSNDQPKNQDSSKENLLEIASKILEESKLPIILWTDDDEGKEILFQFLNNENKSVINVILFKSKKSQDYQINIAPSSLKTQFEKFEPKENDIFTIKYLGTKSQRDGMDYKAFVVRKFDKEKNKFVTTKQLN